MTHVIFDDYLAKRRDVPDAELYRPNRARDKAKVTIYSRHYAESSISKNQNNPPNVYILFYYSHQTHPFLYW